MSKTLEGMNAAHERGYAESWDSNPAIHSSVTKHLAYYDANAAAMRAALLWLADQMEENGDAVKHCKLAAVSAYLASGQEGRAMVEPVRLMKAISAALRAAGDGR